MRTQTGWLKNNNSNTSKTSRRFRLQGERLESRLTPAADLLPYTPAGWSNSIVISTQPGTNTDAATLTIGDPILVDIAYINNGTTAAVGDYDSTVTLDAGSQVTLPDNGLPAGYYATFEDITFSNQYPSAGSHNIVLTLDANNTIAESNEGNNTASRNFNINLPASPTALTIPVGDVLTTPNSAWLHHSGTIVAGTTDKFTFTLTNPSGVFFDLDSRDLAAPLSTSLDASLALFSSTGTLIASNQNGFDFRNFAAPTMSVSTATAAGLYDPALYVDLAPGTYYLIVIGDNGTAGNYHLHALADTTYSASIPILNSYPSASDTLYLDFNGHASSTDAWATRTGGSPYTASAFDLDGNPGTYSPAERLAMRNIWRIVAEDFSPFALNVSTVDPGTFNDGVAYRQVITNSPASIIGGGSAAGIAFLSSYASGTSIDNIGFTFASAFGQYGSGMNGSIMAAALEMGNTTSHEFGHALGLQHYNSTLPGAPDAGNATVIPWAIMATPATGISRKTWATGNAASNFNAVISQDDVTVIASATNTFGYRNDDHGNNSSTATILTAAGTTFTATGIIHSISDVDYFKFTASGNTTISVNLDNYASNLDSVVYLYQGDGTTLIASNDPSNSFDSVITQTLAAGMYYVAVASHGDYGQIGQYSLTINTTNVVTPTLSAILSGGTLTITDEDPVGKMNQLTVSSIGSDLVITDANEMFTGAPLGGRLSNGDKTLTIPLANLTGLTVLGRGGNDTIAIGNLANFNGNLLLGEDTATFANITFNGNISLTSNKSITAYSQSIVTSAPINTLNGSITFLATNGISIGGSITTGGGNISWNADSDSNGTGLLSVNAAISTSTGSASILAADIDLQAAITSSSIVTLSVSQATRLIDIGTNTVGSLGLTDSELDNISAGSLQIGDANSGLITVSAAITHANHLTISSGAGITVNSAITMSANKSLTALAIGKINLATATSNISTSGTGNLSLTTQRDIALVPGSSAKAVDGNIIMSANQQPTPTAGSYPGVFVNGGSIQSLGTGTITVTGRGGNGNGSTGNQHGVLVQNGGTITGGNTGAVIIQGAGGNSPGNTNYGVMISGAGSAITSTGGNVSVNGQGGGVGASGSSHGVLVNTGGVINAGGAGKVQVTGTGSATTGASNYGVYVIGTNAAITSSGGNVTVTGTGGGSSTSSANNGILVFSGGLITAGGSGNVTVNGVGGAGSGNTNIGIWVTGTNSKIASSGGNVTIIGQGGGTSNSTTNYGVLMNSGGTITAGGGGMVSIQGTGGATSGNSNYGVWISGIVVTTSGGNLGITGKGGGTGASATNYGVIISTAGQATAGGSGTVSIQGTGGPSTGTSNFGVYISGSNSNVTSNSGIVTVTGFGGGSNTSANNCGVVIDTGMITAGSTAGVNVTGTGGATGGNGNSGVVILNSGSSITSSGGNVTVVGQGGGTGTSIANYGVTVNTGGQIFAGGSGKTTVSGTGGATAGTDNIGVHLSTSSARITSSGGAVSVTGQGGGVGSAASNLGIFIGATGEITAGGSGSVTVQGTGAATSGNANYGIWVTNTASRITSSGGNVNVVGTGGGRNTSNDNIGIIINSTGSISAGSTGALTVAGTGGASDGNFSIGVYLTGAGSTIGSAGGVVGVTATSGNPTSEAIRLDNASTVSSGGLANLTINADSINIVDTASVIRAGTTGSGVVTLRTRTPGTLVDLGGADVLSGNLLTLGLTDTELDCVSASTLSIGDGGSGAITVSANVDRASSTNISLTSGGAINFAGGSLNTAGGKLTLSPGSAGVNVATALVDAIVGTDAAKSLAFTPGSKLNIAIAGPVVDSEYQQLNVMGAVDLTGVILNLSNSLTTGAQPGFVIVNNDGVDAVTGTFTGLPQNSILLSGNYRFKINYAGGDGNDVELNIIPRVTAIVPDTGPNTGGTTVVLTGTGFSNTTLVTFAGVPASYVIDSDTMITATAPAGDAGPVDVLVVSALGDSAPVVFTYTSSGTSPTAPTVTINNGMSIIDANQPSGYHTFSRLMTVELVFNTTITSVDADAFTFASGVFSIANGGAVIVSGLNSNVLTLTFTGTAGVEFGSLETGIWTLTTDLAKVHAGATNGTGTDTKGNIRRLFGDINGDGQVDSGDFGVFGATFGLNSSDPNFEAQFDVDGNGDIDSGDFGAFGARFGTGL